MTKSKKKQNKLFERFKETELPRFNKNELTAGTVLGPLPCVLVTSAVSREGSVHQDPNLLTAAWTGIVNTKPPILSLSVRPERYSHSLIKGSGEFVVNMVTSNLAARVDFCGVKSGRDVNKWEVCGFHAEACPSLSCAPLLAEAPLSLACKVIRSENLGSHEVFFAEIVAIYVAESLMDSKGKILLEKFDFLTYFHGDYYSLERILGFFGYSIAGKEVLQKRLSTKGSAKAD